MLRTAKTAALFAGAILVFAGCHDIPDVVSPSAVSRVAPAASLIDGANANGNAHFFFLPPIATRPNVTGSIDASLSPVVEICKWQSGACVLLVSRLNARLAGEHYSAVWHTRGLNLDPALTYRLRVLVAGAELGSAEIDVMRNASEKRGSADLSVPLVAGQSLPVKFRVEQGAVWVIGAAGGSISALGGQVQLNVPPGALAADVGITIQPTSGDPPAGGFLVAGAMFELGPHGVTFQSPVQLTIAYEDANLPSGREEHELKLLHFTSGRWEAAMGSLVNAQANTVSGLVMSFSPFAPGGGSVITFSGTGTATIDGVVDAAEWAGAACQTFQAKLPSGAMTPATLCVMNDATNLYVSARYAQAAVTGDNQLYVSLDNLDDGPTAGDDDLASQHPSPFPFTDAFLRSDPGCLLNLCPEPDEVHGGTSDGAAKFANVNGISAHEIAHPFNSTDNAHDLSAGPGSIVGFSIGLAMGTISDVDQTDYPALIDHAHIVIAGVQPQTPFILNAISAGGTQSCAIRAADDALFCWGSNGHGQLGIGAADISVHSKPEPVVGGIKFKQVSAGAFFTCGVATNGTGYCWGMNGDGRLGIGSTLPKAAPTAVSGGHTFATISAGHEHACGITTAGTLYCWGSPTNGRLGLGQNVPVTLAPQAVNSALTFTAVSAGPFHTCAVGTGGAAYCWGRNQYGEIGNGVIGGVLWSPTAVGGGLTFKAIAAGQDHSCGVTTTNAAHCWGLNAWGNLGDGTTNQTATPVLVSGAHGFADIGAGQQFTCGITTLGVVYCWGTNLVGQLGNGTNATSHTPSAISGGLVFTRLEVGVNHTCAMTAAGDGYCWSENNMGMLGNGSTTNSTGPVKVSTP